MKSLIIETSCEKSFLLLADKGKSLLFRPLLGGAELSKSLALEVEELLKGVSVDFIAAGTGPGSYTGIRVGAALAKALAFGWKIPLIGFCSLAAFAPSQEPFAVLVDARMGGFYAYFSETQKAERISPSDPRLSSLLLASPHPVIIAKRLPLLPREMDPNPELLAALVYRQFLEGESKPFTLSYLSSP